jgi:hypothetical protein
MLGRYFFAGWIWVATRQPGAKHRLDGRAYQRDEMGMYFERMARTPTWIAGLAVCSLAVLAISAIVRSIPASYADIPKQRMPSKPASSDDARAIDLKADVALVRETIHRRNSTSCRECALPGRLNDCDARSVAPKLADRHAGDRRYRTEGLEQSAVTCFLRNPRHRWRRFGGHVGSGTPASITSANAIYRLATGS